MRIEDRSSGKRVAAGFAVLALLLALLGSTGGWVADSDAPGESCVGCEGCDSGECGGDGENPLTSHHHCCTTSCLAHAPLSFPVAPSNPAPVLIGPMVQGLTVPVAGRTASAPYRPPRV
jgi:hypothetical protein